MSELAEIINQIEGLRSSTLEAQQHQAAADPEAAAACHELHTALDRYQGILMRIGKVNKG